MTTFLFAAIFGAGRKTGVTFTADHAITIVFFGKSGKGWVNGPATKTEH